MSNSGYSTITQNSLLQAVGPFLFSAKNQHSGNTESIRQAVQITWTTGTANPGVTISLAQADKKQFVWEANYYEDLMNTSYATMLASEAVLSRDWETPEEDEAWKDL